MSEPITTVKIQLAITVPVESWTLNFGVDEVDVPGDVAEYVENTIHGALVNTLGVNDTEVRVDVKGV